MLYAARNIAQGVNYAARVAQGRRPHCLRTACGTTFATSTFLQKPTTVVVITIDYRVYCLSIHIPFCVKLCSVIVDYRRNSPRAHTR